MEEILRHELLAKTKQALDLEDWNAVIQLWQPWVEQGDAEAEYQLAYHYLRCTPSDDDATREQMKDLLRAAAAKEHPDAIWLLATCESDLVRTNPEFEKEILRAGRLGSIHAQRMLGVVYATGDWSGPKDLAEAARWYRLAAEKGEPESQYDLGFMLLLGEGVPKNIEEGLMWLERAGGQGASSAFRLLMDCYENGYCDVPVDAGKAQLWRSHLEEHERLNPPRPSRRYLVEGIASECSLECLWEIEGVTGFSFMSGDNQFYVSYDPALITSARLDQEVSAAGLSASPLE